MATTEPMPAIALFVYARPKHTARVLEGLRTNGVERLYVFSDGPKTEKDRPAVEAVRQTIRSIDGMKITLHERTDNLGLGPSIVAGVEEVLQSHDRLVVLEDDCVPAPGFMAFHAQALKRYEHDERVGSISGYGPPIDIPADYPYDAYWVERISSWGWSTWRQAWRRVYRQDLEAAVREAKERNLDLKSAGADFEAIVRARLDGTRPDIWTPNWGIGALLEGMYTLWPTRSFLTNIGFDGTGMNCSVSERYGASLSVKTRDFRFPPSDRVDPVLAGRFYDFYARGQGRRNLPSRIFGKISSWLQRRSAAPSKAKFPAGGNSGR